MNGAACKFPHTLLIEIGFIWHHAVPLAQLVDRRASGSEGPGSRPRGAEYLRVS